VDNCSATGPPSRSSDALSSPPNCERSPDRE
jgi:hypothetical protein